MEITSEVLEVLWNALVGQLCAVALIAGAVGTLAIVVTYKLIQMLSAKGAFGVREVVREVER
jgi:hypothetical protein